MLSFELKEIKEVETKKKLSHTYTLVPIEKHYKEYLELKIKGDLSTEIMERFRLGLKIGDAATVEIVGLNKQGKLPSSEKKKEC